jgi:hypothetical protein
VTLLLGTKPYTFIGFGDVHGPKPYKFIGFGDIHGPKPYKFPREAPSWSHLLVELRAGGPRDRHRGRSGALSRRATLRGAPWRAFLPEFPQVIGERTHGCLVVLPEDLSAPTRPRRGLERPCGTSPLLKSTTHSDGGFSGTPPRSRVSLGPGSTPSLLRSLTGSLVYPDPGQSRVDPGPAGCTYPNPRAASPPGSQAAAGPPDDEVV